MIGAASEPDLRRLVPTTNLTSTHEFSAAGGKYVGAVWTKPKSFDLLIKFISNFRGKKNFT